MSLGVPKRLGHAYIVGASALFMEAIDFSWFLNADRLTAIFRGRLHPAIGFTRTCSHGHEDADVRRLWRKDASALQRNPTPSGKMHPHSGRSEEHTSELQSLMRISYADFSLKK